MKRSAWPLTLLVGTLCLSGSALSDEGVLSIFGSGGFIDTPQNAPGTTSPLQLTLSTTTTYGLDDFWDIETFALLGLGAGVPTLLFGVGNELRWFQRETWSLGVGAGLAISYLLQPNLAFDSGPYVMASAHWQSEHRFGWAFDVRVFVPVFDGTLTQVGFGPSYPWRVEVLPTLSFTYEIFDFSRLHSD